MPRSSNPGTLVLVVMYLLSGAFMLMLGVVFSTGGGLGLLIGIPAILGGASFVGAAVQLVRSWWKAVRYEKATITALREKIVDRDPFQRPDLVWAHWTYDGREWAAHTRRELTFRPGKDVLLSLLGLAVGAVIVGGGPGLGVAAVVAVLILAVRGVKVFLAYRANRRARIPEVVIGAGSILFNGRYQVLQDHQYRFGGARYLENERPPILELTVHWTTSNGVTNERYRIPVPEGREAEARQLVPRFERHYGQSPAAAYA